jgi:hypothetical protein
MPGNNNKQVLIGAGSVVAVIAGLSVVHAYFVLPKNIMESSKYTDHQIERHNINKHAPMKEWMKSELGHIEDHLLRIEKKVDKLEAR